MAIVLMIAMFGGGICAMVASSKNRNALGWFIIGFLIPLIGVIMVLVMEPLGGKAPAPQQGVATVAPMRPQAPQRDEDPTRTLQKLADLRDRGVITPEEFEQKKREVLARV